MRKTLVKFCIGLCAFCGMIQTTTGGTFVAARHPRAEQEQGDNVRIGVAAVHNRTNRPHAEKALRDRLVNYLNETRLDAITLEGETPDDISAEAKAKECDYVLYTEVVNFKNSTGSKLSGLLGRSSDDTNANGKYDAKLEYRLVKTSDLTEAMQSNVTVKKDDGGDEGGVMLALEREAKAIAEEIKKK